MTNGNVPALDPHTVSFKQTSTIHGLFFHTKHQVTVEKIFQQLKAREKTSLKPVGYKGADMRPTPRCRYLLSFTGMLVLFTLMKAVGLEPSELGPNLLTNWLRGKDCSVGSAQPS